jgi:hypothetical protein
MTRPPFVGFDVCGASGKVSRRQPGDGFTRSVMRAFAGKA